MSLDQPLQMFVLNFLQKTCIQECEQLLKTKSRTEWIRYCSQGIIVESVLMKSIQLPNGLSSSIERKLQAEQDAMRMEFVLQQEKKQKE
jgi:regulator of protease activity HflC (stomatin/prohibitin superfamily)